MMRSVFTRGRTSGEIKTIEAVLPGLPSTYSEQVKSGKGNMLSGNNRGSRFSRCDSQAPRRKCAFFFLNEATFDLQLR